MATAPSFTLPAAPEPEATESDLKMVTTTLDPELAAAFDRVSGDRARSGVLRYMVATCLQAAGEDINPATYSRIGRTKAKKVEVEVDE